MRALRLAAAAAAVAACGGHTVSNDNSKSTAPTQFVLAVSTQGDGLVRGIGSDCRGSCTQRASAGSRITLQGVPDQGATFSGWGGSCSGTTDCTVTLNGDAAVTATFARTPPKPKHTLTVLVDGHGSVRSTPDGIDCGNVCAVQFDEGTSVTLTANPDAGYLMAAWGGACAGAGDCSATVNADTLVRARFDALPPPPPPKMVTLSVAVSGHGAVAGNGIDCPGTCSAQLTSGTAVMLTARAAPGARFMGFAGACSGGTCSLPAVSADTSVSARFEDEVMTLAPADGTNFGLFAINATQVFFQRYGSGIYGLWSVPKTGGTPRLLGPSYCCINFMIADESYFYWSAWGSISRVPVGGGAVEHLFNAPGSINGLALDGQDLYWDAITYSYPSGTTAGVFTGNAAGGAITQLASAVNPGGVAVDSQYVYWTDRNQTTQTGTIMRAPRAGGAATTVIDCGACSPAKLRLDYDNIYYRNNNGDLWVRGKSGGDFVKLNSGNPATTSSWAADFDVNAKVAYWTWNAWDNASTQGLFMARADGSGWAAIETAVDNTWIGPLVDANYIFYMHAGALYRRLK